MTVIILLGIIIGLDLYIISKLLELKKLLELELEKLLELKLELETYKLELETYKQEQQKDIEEIK